MQNKQSKYMVEVTEKEARAIGYQRYLRKNRKKPVAVCLLLIVLAFVMMVFTPAVWALVVYGMCLAGAVIIALRLINKAERAGKAFLKEVRDSVKTG